ncbi:isocitrate/isopropylmalate family dehydrogenase [Sphingomicrobium nitratireducens]|uniref:isocitrate/isopropylmalate family dehydrogenase n=1 Tax=Sphingomicrobium nitratireducens TaxID=2964666 RepID=UPI002240724C|nr:isocitrate/isopropylmalate family dehydrogenase [Sphingomicrobium nitratireducens]
MTSASTLLEAGDEKLAMMPAPRLSETLERPIPAFDPTATHHIGMFLGEGVGPEVVPVAMRMLEILSRNSHRRFDIHEGGLIGLPAKLKHGSSLSDEAIDFAKDVFARNGALFCGPGGDRFVYETRREFDLYCKFTPLEPQPALKGAGVVRDETVAKTDIIAVREQKGGIYQGQWDEEDGQGGRIATHKFSYLEHDVVRILGVAMRLANTRRKKVHLVTKPGGIPSISGMWKRCAQEMAEAAGVELIEFEIDNAVYQLVANPGQFDVLVSPNMFGDVLADCGSLLLASRGLSYSGNFNDAGQAVYQTGHGAARDIAGQGIANPSGQILSLGMMLRESFSWGQADAALRAALAATLEEGYRTSDVTTSGCQTVGTQAFSDRVAYHLERVIDDAGL